MIRVMVYGDIDLNLIDGSAIWLASVAEVLGGCQDVSVTVLQKTRITRDVVIQSAASLPNVSFIDPWEFASANPETSTVLLGYPTRLTPEAAAAMIQVLDQDTSFDILLVRGFETAAALAKVPELAPKVWMYVTDPMRHTGSTESAQLREITGKCAKVVCQTDEAKIALLGSLELDAEKVFVLPPMIPLVAGHQRPPLDPAAPRLGYSGKFSPPYMILEILNAFDKIRETIPGAEFHIVGDKFHNVPHVEGFVETVMHRLTHTPGVVWHGGVTRDEANKILSRVHVAASWRAPAFDDTVELSTKVLEYSALGIPVLMNPSRSQYRVFGPDYPAYVITEADFVDRFLTLSTSPDLYQRVSQVVQATANNFTFESNRRRLAPVLTMDRPRTQVPNRQSTILWAGHDLKFLWQIKERIEGLGYLSLIDKYEGHVVQHPERSRRLLAEADIIFCEWCLGNAEWYSRNKRAHQRLIVRLHRQELELPFLQRVLWENVDRIIFIAEWVMEHFLSVHPGLIKKAVLIPNALDTQSLHVEKLPGAEFNLGLLGYCPKLKAPHLAFDLFTHLKQLDRRYTLFMKGASPRQLNWLWRRTDERQYYETLRARIDRSAFANSVVFEPHADDVANWFAKIGFILSTSDLEGSHQAVAEGMASGAIPVIRNWLGASRLYPAKYVFSNVSEAVAQVCVWNTRDHYETESTFCRQWATQFDLRRIVKQYTRLFSELLPAGKDLTVPSAFQLL